MNKLCTILLLALPLLLWGGNLSLSVDLSLPASSRDLELQGWGSLSAPGYPQLPYKTINVILPPAAEELSFSYNWSGTQTSDLPAPERNGAFLGGERLLDSPAREARAGQVHYLGKGRWGDVSYARFRVLPATWNGSSWQGYSRLELDLNWSESASAPNRIPPVLAELGKSNVNLKANFFANPRDLDKWYQPPASKNYDYLIVTTPALYDVLSPLVSFRQSQGLVTSFADISVILASTPGANAADKLRNYLCNQYNSHPFTYLLLVGDHDTVPVMYLTPEPDGGETVASDFYYGDLSSIVDTDGDNRLGEYSPVEGVDDYLCDYTPELFVGRISSNNPVHVYDVANRTVLYEQSDAPWKRSALLPAAYLNYGGEPETIYLQTDGADFMEYAKATALAGFQNTTLYERSGWLPSHPCDHPLDYYVLRNLLNTQSYGLVNWSAHGSSGYSVRKVWMNDDNSNGLPDSWEMEWMSMVDRQSFDNLNNSDGTVIFMASCYNGMIDSSQQCIAEYALQRKAVAAMAATRTGWYKIGWRNPGWGGLSSYNLHYLENFARNGLSSGASLAWANLLHTQYYLFGDPVDGGGIIYPELQNVYTYLHYGDPAIGHSGSQIQPLGEILVYEPSRHGGLRVVDALNQIGGLNVVYTDKLIPDYDYINRFEAVFCLFGWGDAAYVPHPDSLDYSLLHGYLNGGGKLYLEGDVAWNSQDPFWSKFGANAPLNMFTNIEAVKCYQDGEAWIWDYNPQSNPNAQVLLPALPAAETIFSTHGAASADASIGILHAVPEHSTIASSFALAALQNGEWELKDMLGLILDRFGVLEYVNTQVDEPQIPMARTSLRGYPNPFRGQTSLRLELPAKARVDLNIYNLRGQKVRSLATLDLVAGKHELNWDGRDNSGNRLAPGIYFWRLKAGDTLRQGKLLKLAD